jgi:hypothetical protein
MLTRATTARHEQLRVPGLGDEQERRLAVLVLDDWGCACASAWTLAARPAVGWAWTETIARPQNERPEAWQSRAGGRWSVRWRIRAVRLH